MRADWSRADLILPGKMFCMPEAKSRPSLLWQEAWVYIDSAQAGDVQEALWEDAAVASGHAQVWP